MDELISIGEFSARSGLSPKRLRSYAAAAVLIPAAVDAASGYRYYAPGQLREAALIDALRRAGLPLAEIGELLRHPSAEVLDGWAERLESDAGLRREALGQARRLLLTENLAAPRAANPARPEHPMDVVELVRSNRGPILRKGTEMRLTVASRSETGHVRERNEDAVVTGAGLAGVADGMGGAPGGRVAADLAVSVLEAAFSGESADGLAAAVRAANRAIWERARAADDLDGMGTTICAVGLVGGDLAVANVGDSRTYLARDGSLVQLTEDHSVSADLVRRGEITEAEGLAHPQRAILTRALGVGPEVDVDSTTRPVAPGDRLLLCTDGLFTEVSGAQIAATLTGGGGVQETADRLVELALAAGGRDNVSVVVAQVEG